MRIRRLAVKSWRNLRDVSLTIPDDSALVCLVGENGTGKSGILEMLSACAHQLGISQGIEMTRGNPFSEDHSVELEAWIDPSEVELSPVLVERLAESNEHWDGHITFSSSTLGDRSEGLRAPSVTLEDLGAQVAQAVAGQLRDRNETQHLYLDADRSYPPMQIQSHQYGDLFQQQWDDPAFTKQFSYRPTRTLYEEWLKFFIGLEQKTSTNLVAEIRRARQAGEPEPTLVDPFDSFRAAVAAVLPHLQFVGVESTGAARTIRFDSMGEELTFSKLSSGEREIAFLIGQIERFRLRRGLLLVDEPELHLNPDLLRTWLAYLRDSIQDGQIWIATHSLEAVEVAGPESCFVFERDSQTRLVSDPQSLFGRPVLAALAASLGAPAFSLSSLRFILVEGERRTRERERYFSVCGDPTLNRFIEGGSCREVLRRLTALRELAEETNEQLRVGAVIDRDFHSAEEVAGLEAEHGVHVLECHEVENLFIEPSVVARAATEMNLDDLQGESLLRDAADRFAGLWVVQRASWAWPEMTTKPARTAISGRSWKEIDSDWEGLVNASANDMGDLAAAWSTRLSDAKGEYELLRSSHDLWRQACGKQVLQVVADRLGFNSVQSYERLVVRLWAQGPHVPDAVHSVRRYVDGLTAVPQ